MENIVAQTAPASGNANPAENQPQARLPREYERRFESEKELKTFLDEKELLKRLPVSRRTLWNWRHQKKIPSIVIGRRVLYCWDSVAEALRRLERGGVE
jgi:hypothetical protein